MTNIRDFKISIDSADLKDLQGRLKNTRWPEPETPDDWTQGVPLAYMPGDLRATGPTLRLAGTRGAAATRSRSSSPTIDGLDIHFIHVRSPHAERAAADDDPRLAGFGRRVPQGHRAADRPDRPWRQRRRCLPRGLPVAAGLRIFRQADDHRLGRREDRRGLGRADGAAGLRRYVAQGGDWGSAVTTAIGVQNRGAMRRHPRQHAECRAHAGSAGQPDRSRTKAALAGRKYYQDWDSGYSKQQAPGRRRWATGWSIRRSARRPGSSRSSGPGPTATAHPENALTPRRAARQRDAVLADRHGASSARLYWESFGRAFGGDAGRCAVPTGCSIFPKEIVATAAALGAERYTNIVYWNELDRGGHFAAFEQPELFVDELRTCFRLMR